MCRAAAKAGHGIGSRRSALTCGGKASVPHHCVLVPKLKLNAAAWPWILRPYLLQATIGDNLSYQPTAILEGIVCHILHLRGPKSPSYVHLQYAGKDA
jgi:hypothetical protein